MTDLPADIQADLDRLEREGFTFETHRAPCPAYPVPAHRQEEYAVPGDWAPRPPKRPKPPKPPKPPKAPKAPKPPKAPKLPKPPRPPKPVLTLVRDPAQVGCTAPDALPQGYVARFEVAEARLAAGWKQGQCLACGRWRWSDEACAVSRFKRAPVQGLPLEDPYDKK